MSRGKASNLMVKYRIKRHKHHYDLRINGRKIMCLVEYSKIVSESKLSTYDQVLIGEVLKVLDFVSVPYIIKPQPRILSIKVYRDLRSTFRRSRRAGEAKALALAKKLYLDDFNRLLQTRAWIKIGSPPRILKLKMTKDRLGYYCYSMWFTDGVDSITIKEHSFLADLFSVFWYFKTQRVKQLISLLSNSWRPGFRSSIHGVKGETLLKALGLALRHDTTLGAALFLTARE